MIFNASPFEFVRSFRAYKTLFSSSFDPKWTEIEPNTVLLMNRTDDLSVTKGIGTSEQPRSPTISSADILKTNPTIVGWWRYKYFYPRFSRLPQMSRVAIQIKNLNDACIVNRVLPISFSLNSIHFQSKEFWTEFRNSEGIGQRRLLRFRVITSFYNFRPIYDFVHEAKKNVLKVCDESGTKGWFDFGAPSCIFCLYCIY